ncbi:MAG: hypothetical protein SF052_05875 [Bacteroidia bacterium]|nr:hypothetical protein [Bacteroidia bacterium]
MKKSFVYLIVCTFFSFFHIPGLFAQKALYKPQTHQLELQVAGLNYIPSLGELYKEPLPFSGNMVNGLRYTYHYSLTHGFRGGISYRTANFTDSAGVVTGFSAYEGSKRDLDISLGYIYKYHKGAAQFFAGADLRYTPGKVTETGITPGNSSYNNEYNYTNYGASGFIGLRYFLNTYLSAAVEGSAYYLRVNHNEWGNGEPFFQLTPDHEAGANLNLSLSLHLIKMKKRCTCPRH